jgi:ATP-binding cassette subfamily B multidrug efflux pump
MSRNTNSLYHLSYLNEYFVKYRWHFIGGIVFVSASNYFRVLQPQMIREALDLVIENIGMYSLFSGMDNQAIFFASLGKILLFFGVLVLILALIMGVFMYLMRQTIVVMSRLIEYDIRKAVYAHYSRLSQDFYKRNKTGDLMSRITEDVNKVRTYLGPAVLYGINLVTLFIMVIYAMVQVSWELTLYCLSPLPFLTLSIYYVSSMINRRSEVIQQQLSKLNSLAQETYSGIRVLKSYVQEKSSLRHFAEESEVYHGKAMHLVKVDALFYPVMLLLVGASTVITVYIGGLQVISGKITTGNIAEFVIYVNMLTWPMTSIGWIASIVQQAAASQKRINEFLHLQPSIQNPGGHLEPIEGRIEFRQVRFVYPDTGIEALRKIDFKLEPGQKMAIVGRTGSGKSTIADLLVRLYDVSEGQILIDGRDLRKHQLDHLRQRIGYVPQDVFLFSDTVSHNIAFGNPGASQEEIEQYARYASIHKEILDLPQGYNSLVGERGVTLSGGQKQRVSIARALMKQPDILLFDDCLSAVDTRTEKEILRYFEEQLADKTAIIITHRIYSLLEFDKILVLDQGRIIQEGTHKELIRKEGYYRELYEKQRAEEDTEQPVSR